MHKKHKKQTSDFRLDVFYAHKKHKKHKSINVKQAIFFFFLDLFYKQEKHKNANKQIGDFLPFRCFLNAFKNVFFVFCSLFVRFFASCAFCAFLESFRKKMFKITLITSYILLLRSLRSI